MIDWLCSDCNINCWEISEYYMVHDDIWESVVPSGDGMLCLGCLEGRLGRILTAADFTEYPINHGFFPRSDRMLNRLGL